VEVTADAQFIDIMIRVDDTTAPSPPGARCNITRRRDIAVCGGTHTATQVSASQRTRSARSGAFSDSLSGRKSQDLRDERRAGTHGDVSPCPAA